MNRPYPDGKCLIEVVGNPRRIGLLMSDFGD